jgi:hypothetical protein
MLAIVLEGAFRKWVLPASLHSLAYGSKDILAAMFIVRFGLPYHARMLRPLRDQIIMITCLLAPSFILGLTWSVTAAIMIFKNAVLWPLFAVHFAAWFDWASLNKLTRLLSILGALIAVLGIIQFSSPPDSTINQYAWHVMGKAERVATFGMSSTGVRATGTFSYITGYSTFASIGFLWMIWRLLNAVRTLDRCFCILGVISCLVCILTSGSRAPLYQCVLGLIAAVIASSHIRHKFRAFVLLAILIVTYVAVMDRQLAESFYVRVSPAGDSPAARITGAGLGFLSLMLDHPLGVGMGQETNVSDYRIAERLNELEFTEDGRSRVAIEGGILAVLAQAATLLLFFRMIGLAWKTRSDESRIGAAAMLPAATYLLANSLWYDHTASALWWFFIGAWLAITLRSCAPVSHPVRQCITGRTASTYAARRAQSPVWKSELV